MEDVVHDVEFLARSETRVRILKELVETGGLSITELRERVDAHRTSINRNVEALADRGWIHRTNHHLRIDPSGELVIDDFLALVDSVRLADRLQPFLRWIDTDLFDVELELLEDAEVWTAEPGDPLAMVNRHVERLMHVDEAYIMIPVTSLDANRVVYERVIDHGARIDLIVAPDVVRTLRSNPAYSEYFESMKEADRHRYYVYEGEIPFFLGVIDGVVQIGVDEDQEPRALLESTNTAVVGWAERTLDAYKADSTPLGS